MSYTKVDEHMIAGVSGEDEVFNIIDHLVGFTLGDALKIALEKGYCVENISITAPPKLEISEYDQSFRVLRVYSLGDNRLTILVCKPL